jgi:hypothetical protein
MHIYTTISTHSDHIFCELKKGFKNDTLRGLDKGSSYKNALTKKTKKKIKKKKKKSKGWGVKFV